MDCRSLHLLLVLLTLSSSTDGTPESIDDSDLGRLDVGILNSLRYEKEPTKCGSDEPCSSPPSGKCWGFEKNCKANNRLLMPVCTGTPQPYASTMEGKAEKFDNQAGMGYAKDFYDSLETVCHSNGPEDSSLACGKDLNHCRATNLYLDFRKSDFEMRAGDRAATARLRPDFIEEKMLGGKCRLDRSKLKQPKYSSHLQSWWAELKHFAPMDKPTNAKGQHCDAVVSRPVIFMKMDAKINMYHHFCDFVNLYVSQLINGSFTREVQIVDWDTSNLDNKDPFEDTWRAFSKYKVKRLSDYTGKRVCFKEVLFPLLPRMVFGLFYNMPVAPGCTGGGLMESFSHHLLNRLNIRRTPTKTDLEARRIRILFMSRGTRFRNVLNEQTLISALKTVGEYAVRHVTYDRSMPFRKQVESSHNADILIGMHGAGLTHMLFLPDWAGVFEIYNTQDPNCYKDLAAIRGLEYQTWEKDKLLQPEDGGHHKIDSAKPKFTNYNFDMAEFLRLVGKLADRVRPRRDKLRRRPQTNKDEL